LAGRVGAGGLETAGTQKVPDANLIEVCECCFTLSLWKGLTCEWERNEFPGSGCHAQVCAGMSGMPSEPSRMILCVAQAFEPVRHSLEGLCHQRGNHKIQP
jgi:hypothetical protein